MVVRIDSLRVAGERERSRRDPHHGGMMRNLTTERFNRPMIRNDTPRQLERVGIAEGSEGSVKAESRESATREGKFAASCSRLLEISSAFYFFRR
jgi:hypothetical protein